MYNRIFFVKGLITRNLLKLFWLVWSYLIFYHIFQMEFQNFRVDDSNITMMLLISLIRPLLKRYSYYSDAIYYYVDIQYVLVINCELDLRGLHIGFIWLSCYTSSQVGCILPSYMVVYRILSSIGHYVHLLVQNLTVLIVLYQIYILRNVVLFIRGIYKIFILCPNFQENNLW